MFLIMGRAQGFHYAILHRLFPRSRFRAEIWDGNGIDHGSVRACVRAEGDPMGFPGWVGVSRVRLLGGMSRRGGKLIDEACEG